MKNVLLCRLAVLPVLALTVGGCLQYTRPPAAVSSDSYTALQEKEKNLLPEKLDTLTLEQAQSIALANNPDFRSIQFSIDSARARYYQSFSSYAPTLNAGMSVSQSFGKMFSSSNSPKTSSQSESYQPSLSGQLLIFDSLAREMNILATKYTLLQTESTVADAQRLLLRAVAYAYNDVQLAHAQREIVLAQIEYSKEMLEDAERKYNAGTVLLSDVLNFRVTLRNGQLNLVKVDYSIQSALYVLAGYLGLTDGTIPAAVKFPAIAMPATPILPAIEVYMDQALANRPDLRAYRDQLKVARYNYYGAFSAFGPTVAANYSLNYSQNHNIVHGGGSSGGSSGSGNLGYGLNASWNLFNGFSDYYNLKAAGANVAEVDFMLAQIWLDVITDVRTAYENLRSSVKEAVISKEICDLTKATRDLVENEYNAGTALVTRLNEAERDLVQAQNNLATAIVNIANAQAQLDAAVYAIKTPVAEPVPTGPTVFQKEVGI